MMKLFTLGSAALIASTKASSATIAADYLAAVQNNPMAAAERTITQDDMDLINEYGCWCYFQDAHGSGKGKPVDEIDTLCKMKLLKNKHAFWLFLEL